METQNFESLQSGWIEYQHVVFVVFSLLDDDFAGAGVARDDVGALGQGDGGRG